MNNFEKKDLLSRIKKIHFKNINNKIDIFPDEIYELFPEINAVEKIESDDESDKYYLDYGQLAPLLLFAIKEQQIIIERQTKIINELELQITTDISVPKMDIPKKSKKRRWNIFKLFKL